jgi:RNA polymerase sigma-70 factor (ECF subfamily)
MMSRTVRSQRAPEEPTRHQTEPFEEFYRREYGRIVAIARALSPDRGAAEDLAQESFAAAHRNWDRISRYEDPRGWVRRVMTNRATSMRRRISAEIRALARAGHDPDRGLVDLTPTTEAIWEEVRALPRRQQQAVVLHYVGQLTTEEMSETMGCSPGAVKTHLHRGRETLRSRLGDWREG